MVPDSAARDCVARPALLPAMAGFFKPN